MSFSQFINSLSPGELAFLCIGIVLGLFAILAGIAYGPDSRRVKRGPARDCKRPGVQAVP